MPNLTSLGSDIGSGLKDLSQSAVNGLMGGSANGLYSSQISRTFPSGAQDLLSTTNDAVDCFALQQFSATLQAFMLNYAKQTSGMYSIYR